MTESMIFGRHGLYHAATESAAYDRLGLIARLAETLEELVSEFIDDHTAECSCGWCEYDRRGNYGHFLEDLVWLRGSLGIGVGHITSHVQRPETLGETPAERLRYLAYLLETTGDDMVDEAVEPDVIRLPVTEAVPSPA